MSFPALNMLTLAIRSGIGGGFGDIVIHYTMDDVIGVDTSHSADVGITAVAVANEMQSNNVGITAVAVANEMQSNNVGITVVATIASGSLTSP